ncbi:MAG: Uma2 family endonuclease [Bryobacteraceae bacterium]
MAIPVPRMTVEEYLAADAISETPLEFHDGEVFSAFDGSPAHAGLAAQVCIAVGYRLRGTPCSTYTALQVRVSPVQYAYSDVAVVCGGLIQTSEKDASVSNPKVIFEILSPTTQDYDYGGKFLLYRRLPSIQEYVLVSRDQPRVEVYRRVPEEKWMLSTYEGIDGTLILESLDLRIPLNELYA